MLNALSRSVRLLKRTEERRWTISLLVVLTIASIIYLTGIVSPPSLMDDTDAVEA